MGRNPCGEWAASIFEIQIHVARCAAVACRKLLSSRTKCLEVTSESELMTTRLTTFCARVLLPITSACNAGSRQAEQGVCRTNQGICRSSRVFARKNSGVFAGTAGCLQVPYERDAGLLLRSQCVLLVYLHAFACNFPLPTHLPDSCAHARGKPACLALDVFVLSTEGKTCTAAAEAASIWSQIAAGTAQETAAPCLRCSVRCAAAAVNC